MHYLIYTSSHPLFLLAVALSLSLSLRGQHVVRPAVCAILRKKGGQKSQRQTGRRASERRKEGKSYSQTREREKGCSLLAATGLQKHC